MNINEREECTVYYLRRENSKQMFESILCPNRKQIFHFASEIKIIHLLFTQFFNSLDWIINYNQEWLFVNLIST